MWKFGFVNYGPVFWSQPVKGNYQFKSQAHKLVRSLANG